ncbi:hypothetical protein EG328_007150 [Venturia inaequalis]|uniref:Uncharacterized protein n=1 Tax=Venturia inaequalis TaxID=5025 RepID=A0A8H3UUN4_VENIN|nr:hypothetical protein EG328_007150 [Venturia inaequalis]KAE9975618.1 hypothetical protein EG327_008407 [Venturia inaequalis]
MFSFLGASHPPRTNNATNNPIMYENGLSQVSFRKPDSDFIMTHTIPPTTKEKGVSIIVPPFHYHIHQDEYFHIQSGSATIYKGIDPEPFTTLSTSPGGRRKAVIPRKTYHRFENASETETLVIDIHLSPEDYESEQRFFRNFFGYLDDCKSAKVAPSLFQLLVFLHAADTPLALPLPNHTLGLWVSRAFLIGAALVGRWVLGYGVSYDEYYVGQTRDQEQNPWIAREGLNLEASRLSMAPPPAPETRKRGVNGQVYNALASQRVDLRALGHVQQGNTLEDSRGGGDQVRYEYSCARDNASNTSPPVLPSLQSFSINSSELRAFNGYDINDLAQPQAAPSPAGAYTHNGLGLTLYERSVRQARQLTQSPTVADSSAAEEVPQQNSYLPSTMQASSDAGPRNISPTPGFLHRIMDGRHAGPVLDISSIGNGSNTVEDFVHSATELTTPNSADNTPDLGRLHRLVQDARQAINTVTKLEVSPAAPSEVSPGHIVAVQDSQTPQAIPTCDPSPTKEADPVRAAIRKMPVILQQLAPMLNSLQGYLSRNPDISIHESINSLSKRMDSLENASFSHVPPEHINQQFENVDGRIIDLENRVDEHGRIIGAYDPGESLQERHLRRLTAGDNASLDWRQSHEGADSERMDIDRRLRGVEDRLEDLEKSRPPSLAHPWEIEVVLLPWGRELKGVWYPTDELLKPGMTQDSEVWTQACSIRSQSRASVSLGVDRNTGWSSQAIHDWADNTEHWLSPKACGTNGVVFHRLRSRGLVRTVTLHSPGARDVQASIARVYGDLLDILVGPRQPTEADGEAIAKKALLGIQAPFIPLRKVHKSSRLRFLTPPDLVSPALWTADFLTSGVLMRAPAGQKRLFITTHESYIQQSTDESVSWTWDKIRELPRNSFFHARQNINAEAQAREPVVLEACWGHHPTLDGIPSVHSSFASHHSTSFHDPSDNEELSQSEEPEQESDDDPPEFHPITPTSEFPSQRSPYHRRARTVSVPLTDASSNFVFEGLQQRSFPQQPKRRIRQFEQSNSPGLIASLPTFIPSPSKTRSRLGKRRRLAKSRSPSGSPDSREMSVDVDPERVIMHVMDRVSSGESIKPLSAFTPRWSKEPASPFCERSTKAGGSQNTDFGIAVSRKRGVTPSAYATPFSGTNFNSEAVGEEESGDEDVWGGVEERNAISAADDDDEMGDKDDDESMDGDADDEELSQSQDELQAEYYQ